LKALGLEQRESHVTPTQAPPLFSDKIKILITEIDRRCEALKADASFVQKYVFKRDKVFFLVSWWAADRAGGLGRMMGVEITRLANVFFVVESYVREDNKGVKRPDSDCSIFRERQGDGSSRSFD
jgi:hypothetical protein